MMIIALSRLAAYPPPSLLVLSLNAGWLAMWLHLKDGAQRLQAANQDSPSLTWHWANLELPPRPEGKDCQQQGKNKRKKEKKQQKKMERIRQRLKKSLCY